eukprot:TRINITY_DN7166_c0_g2_i1.p1 TRINITY_DN7166_c0_g2~~TRINITY_DN7166_c0_g2_i1.p1  ORF type:complete len:2821 (+),score=787.28 TRINITY_DN7166_c0_g2_i1:559-8463(+)
MVDAGHTPAGEEAADAIAAAGLTLEAAAFGIQGPTEYTSLHASLLLGAALIRTPQPGHTADAAAVRKLAATAAHAAVSHSSPAVVAAAVECAATLASVNRAALTAALLRTEFNAAVSRQGSAGAGARALLLAVAGAGCGVGGQYSALDFARLAAHAAAEGDAGDAHVSGTLAACHTVGVVDAAALECLLSAGLWEPAATMCDATDTVGCLSIQPQHIDDACAAGCSAAAAQLLAAAPASCATPERVSRLTGPTCVVRPELADALSNLLEKIPSVEMPPLHVCVERAIAAAVSRRETCDPSEVAAADSELRQATLTVDTEGCGSAEWLGVAHRVVVPLLSAPWGTVSIRRAAAAACLRIGDPSLSICVLELAVRERNADMRLDLLLRAASATLESGAGGDRMKQALLLLAGDGEPDVVEKATSFLVAAENAECTSLSLPLEAAGPAQDGSPVSPGSSNLLRMLCDNAVNDCQGSGRRAELGMRMLRRLLPSPVLRLRDGEAELLSGVLHGHLEGGSVRMRAAALAALEGLAAAEPAAATRRCASVLGRNEAGPSLVRRACVTMRAILHHGGKSVLDDSDEAALRQRLVTSYSAQPRATRVAAMRLLGKIGAARPSASVQGGTGPWQQMWVDEPRRQGPVPSTENGSDMFADLAAISALVAVISDPNQGRHHEAAAAALRKASARLTATCSAASALGAVPGLLGIAQDEGRKDSRQFRSGVAALALGTVADLLGATDRSDTRHSTRLALSRVLSERLGESVAFSLWRLGDTPTRRALLQVIRQSQRILDGLTVTAQDWKWDVLWAAADLGTRPDTEWDEDDSESDDTEDCRRGLRLLCLQLLAETGGELVLQADASKLVHRLLAILSDPSFSDMHKEALGGLISVKKSLSESGPVLLNRPVLVSPSRESPDRARLLSQRKQSTVSCATTQSGARAEPPAPAPSETDVWHRVFQPAVEQVVHGLGTPVAGKVLKVLSAVGPPSPKSTAALIQSGVPQGRAPPPTPHAADVSTARELPESSRVLDTMQEEPPFGDRAAMQRWFEALCKDLLRESPAPALYAAYAVGEVHPPLAKDLFCVSFTYFQNRAHGAGREGTAAMLGTVGEVLLRCDEVPRTVLAAMLEVAEFAERAFEHACQFDWRRTVGWHKTLSLYKLHKAACCCDQDAKALRYLERSVGLIRSCTANLARRKQVPARDVDEITAPGFLWWRQALQLHASLSPSEQSHCFCEPELPHWSAAARDGSHGRTQLSAVVSLFARTVVRLSHVLLVPDDAKGIITQLAQTKEIQLTASDCEGMRWWDRALALYDNEQSQQQQQAGGRTAPEILAARCQCMDRLGEWSRLVEEAGWSEGGPQPTHLAGIVSRAAVMLGDWSLLTSTVNATRLPGTGTIFSRVASTAAMRSLESMDRMSDESPCGSPTAARRPLAAELAAVADVETLKYRAILAVHACDERAALRASALCIDAIDPRLKDCSEEGLGGRAYDLVEHLQHLEELGEVLEWRKAGEHRRRTLQELWGARVIKGTPNLARLREAYAIRSLAGRGAVDAGDFVLAARRLERPSLGRDLLGALLGVADLAASEWVPTACPETDDTLLTVAYCGLAWEAERSHRVQLLSGIRGYVERLCRSDGCSGEEKCEGLLLQAKIERETDRQFYLSPSRDNLLAMLREATEYAPDSYQACHDWAMMNYRVPQRDPEIHRLTLAADVEATVFAQHAAEGFAKSIELGGTAGASGVEDVLRLLQLHFIYSPHNPSVLRVVQQALLQLPVTVWIEVMPQLVARVGQTPPVGPTVEALLERVAVCSPEPVLWPLVSASRPADDDGADEDSAARLLAKVHATHPELATQVRLVAREFVRAATLWIEHWYEMLVEITDEWARSAGECGRILSLLQRHERELGKPQTQKDAEFIGLYGCKTKAGVKFEGTLDHLFSRLRAWRDAEEELGPAAARQRYEHLVHPLFTELIADMDRRLSFHSLALADTAPALLAARDLAVTVPGTDGVLVSRFSAQMPVLRSKQRPRRVSVHGSDGRLYSFLLKGNEDLRLDQRVMQLLRLVNVLRAAGGARPSRGGGGAIVTYAVVPLSARAGLIGWVEEAQTLHHVLREGCRLVQWDVGWEVVRPDHLRGVVREIEREGAVIKASDVRSRQLRLQRRTLEVKCAIVPPDPITVFHDSLRADGGLICSAPCRRAPGNELMCMCAWRRDPYSEAQYVPLLRCWPASLCNALRKATRSAPTSALARWLWMRARGAEDWAQTRATFAASLAAMSVVGYVIGLGDRHLGNLMLRNDGTVVHIDFGDSFEAAAWRDQVPERVPFRLTPALEAAMGSAGAAGLFRREAVRDMAVLRRGRDSVVAMLEAFVHDPLVGPRIARGSRDLSGALDRVRAKLEGMDFPAGGQMVHRVLNLLRFGVLPPLQEVTAALSSLESGMHHSAVAAISRWLPATCELALARGAEEPRGGERRLQAAEMTSPETVAASPHFQTPTQGPLASPVLHGSGAPRAPTQPAEQWLGNPSAVELRAALIAALGGLGDPPSYAGDAHAPAGSGTGGPGDRPKDGTSPHHHTLRTDAGRPLSLHLPPRGAPDSLTGAAYGASLAPAWTFVAAGPNREAAKAVTVAEQVDMLIQSATCTLNLARSYPPWAPWT